MDGLNPGPLDYNTGALNHSATASFYTVKNHSLTKEMFNIATVNLTVIHFQFDESHLTEITAEVRQVLGMKKLFLPPMPFTFCHFQILDLVSKIIKMLCTVQ